MKTPDAVTCSSTRLSTFAVALLMASASAMASDKTPRVVGGSSAGADQFPWQAAVVFDSADPQGSLHCGGSIINARWILSAGHCADDGAGYVVVGTQDLSDISTAQIIPIAAWHRHPGYVDSTETDPSKVVFDNDIALIELQESIDFDACGTHCESIPLVTLDNEADVMALGSEALVSGWGETYSSTDYPSSYYPPDLRWAPLSVVSCTDSPALYQSNEVSARMFCAAAGVDDFTRDSCSGDSGGPLVVLDSSGTGYVQAGIVSWGSGCAVNGYPGVYTRLSQFQNWIWNTTNGECCNEPTTTPPITPTNSGGGGGGGGGGSVSWLMLLVLPVLSLRKRGLKGANA